MATRPVLGLVLTLTLATGAAASAQLVDDISHNNALTHYRLGEGLFRDEQFAKAADEFQIAVKLDPLLTIAHYELGQSYMALHRYQEAIRSYIGCRAAIATGRDAMTARLEHRISDLERTKQRDITAFETPAEVSLALGSAYFRSGDLPSAEREWKAAIAVNSRLGEAHNNLAALYAMTGRKQQAQESVKQAERSGYQVNPRLKSDIQALAENPKPQTPNPKPQS